MKKKISNKSPSKPPALKPVSFLRNEINKSGVLEQAIEKVEKQFEIADATRPRNVPDFPEHITELSSDIVGDYHSLYKSEVAWIKSRLAIIEIEYDFGKQLVSNYRKQAFLNFRKNGSTVADANAWADVSHEVFEGEKELANIRAQKRLLESRYEVFLDYATVMSREISRRREEENEYSNNNDKKIKGRILNPLKNTGVKL